MTTKKPASQAQLPASKQQDSQDETTLKITEKVGDIFDAPESAVIIHACNCVGSWGAGIAAAFKKLYPQALKAHKSHCSTRSNDSLLGTSQLIPPLETGKPRHFVGCLFTSRKYGRAKDSPKMILENTRPAMEDLLVQIKSYAEKHEVSEVRMCRINAGLFAVPWEETKAVLESVVVEDGMPTEIIAYSLPESECSGK